MNPVPDALSPDAWSGTPAGLAEGISQLGHRVIPIGLKLPPPVRALGAAASLAGGRRGAEADRTHVRREARRRGLRRQLKAVGHLDAVVAMGTELYDLAAVRRGFAFRVATYDDATLAQMWRHPESNLRRSGFQSRRVEEWCEWQRRSIQSADLNFAVSSWVAESLASDYGIPGDKIRVVGIGHRPRVAPDKGRDWARPHYLFVGVEWNRKNGPRLLRAFERARMIRPDISLDLVGGHPDIEIPGITGHGLLPRSDPVSQKKLDSLYAKATAFVLPSLFEPAGISYLEAASVGLPSIATTDGGAPTLLASGVLWVDPRSTQQVTDAMLYLADPIRAEALGSEAAVFARSMTWAAVAERMVGELIEST